MDLQILLAEPKSVQEGSSSTSRAKALLFDNLMSSSLLLQIETCTSTFKCNKESPGNHMPALLRQQVVWLSFLHT